MRRFFASTWRSVVLIWRSSTLWRAAAIFCSTVSTSSRTAGSKSEVLSVWPLTTTICTGVAGRVVESAGVGRDVVDPAAVDPPRVGDPAVDEPADVADPP